MTNNVNSKFIFQFNYILLHWKIQLFSHFASIVYFVEPVLVYNHVEYFNNGPVYENEDIGLDMPLFIMINKIEIVISTIHDPKSNQNYVSKKFLLHLLLDNLPFFFFKTAYKYFISILKMLHFHSISHWGPNRSSYHH